MILKKDTFKEVVTLAKNSMEEARYTKLIDLLLDTPEKLINLPPDQINVHLLLMEYQANLNIKNHIGATALDKANLAGNQEICDLLTNFMQANYIKDSVTSNQANRIKVL